MGAFTFSPLAIPHLFMAASLLAIIVMTVLTRGNALIRIGVLMVAFGALPYAVGMAALITVDEPEVGRHFSLALIGGTALLGPAMMMLLLAMAGRLERYRWWLVVATVVATTMAVLTWTTDLMIEQQMWKSPLGFWFHRARPMDTAAIGQFVLWAAVGLWLSRRGGEAPVSTRQRRLRSRVGIMLVLALTGATDALLANGIGFYPFGVIPGTIAVWLIIFAITRQDLLHSRGFDRAGAIELAVFAISVAAFAGILYALDRAGVERTPWRVAGLVAPILFVAQVTMLLVRHRVRDPEAAPEANPAVETYVELSTRIESELQLVEPLAELLAEHGGLPEARLLMADDRGRLVPVGDPDAAAVEVDARLRPWLIASQPLLVLDELPTMRLGGLRQPIEQFMVSLDAGVAVPLVDRENLVGFIAGSTRDSRALQSGEAEVLREAAGATAKALTYASLFREAEARIEVAKEVEVAAAVQQARTAGEQRKRYGSCELVGYYQPATQFGGHWWSSYELSDGRFMVIMGDVTGSGVSAALVSFTAEGAVETAQAMYGDQVDVVSLLETLDGSVRGVGGAHHGMACFAAIFDPAAGKVTFASAGHPFPYVCRNSGGRPELRALVSRGTPLGTDPLVLSPATFDLAADDMVICYSDSLVEARSPEGDVYGDRRLQRLIRSKVASAGDDATQVILDDAMRFWGERELEDDLNVVVIRLGAAG